MLDRSYTGPVLVADHASSHHVLLPAQCRFLKILSTPKATQQGVWLQLYASYHSQGKRSGKVTEVPFRVEDPISVTLEKAAGI